MSDKMVMYDQIKAVNNATINVDTAEGVVEAFAAAIGNKDSVGDIIVPGAFAKSLQRRKPRVVWGHDWNSPIGKVLEIEEVPPTDPRIPAKMKAMGVGGLYVKVQFNLGSQRGKEAFNDVLFYGTEQEWSIGYKTLRKNYDPERQANVLHEVELYEVSPVLHGANNLTSTLSIKSDEEQGVYNSNGTTNAVTWWSVNDETKTNEDNTGTWNFEAGEAKMYGVAPEMTPEMKLRKAFMSAFGPFTDLQFVGDDQAVFKKPDGMWAIKYRIEGPKLMVTRPKKARIRVEVEEPKPMIEEKPMPDNMPPKLETSSGHGDDEEHRGTMYKTDYSEDRRMEMAKTGMALPDGSYPIENTGDLKNAIQAYGRAKDKEAAKRHIIKRARALGETQMLPEEWGVMEKSLEDGMEEKAGRVISMSNMNKLSKAADMIQEVIKAGTREMPKPDMRASETKSMLQDYKSGDAGVEHTALIRYSDWLVGKTVVIKAKDELPTLEKVSAMLDGLIPLADQHDWTVSAPAQKSFEDGNCSLEVMFSTEDDMADQVKSLSEFLKSADCNVSVDIVVEDFYEKGVKHHFEEVFVAE